ncbi:MAG: ATP-binding protein [Intestinibacillus sp.]
MAYDKEILSETLRELETERAERERELSERRAEVYEQVPRIRVIDDTLRGAAASVVRAALESGDDPTEAVARLRDRNLSLQRERTSLLIQNGFAADYLSLRPSCPVCADLGYIGTRPCECLKARYARRLTERLSTILPIADQNFESFRFDCYSEMPDARMGISPRENMDYNFDQCSEYARHFNEHSGNLLLYGSAGLGKTFLSTCIAKVVAERGFSVAYDTAIAILGHFETEKFGGFNAENAARQIHKYKNADLLIIDDLGAELTTAFTVSALYGLLNHRLMVRRPMIVNTNLLPGELEKRYSPAIASRILGEFTQLRFFGEDIRLLKRRKGGL